MNTLTPDTITATDVAASLQQGAAYACWTRSTRSIDAWILLPMLRLLTSAATRIAEHLERQERQALRDRVAV